MTREEVIRGLNDIHAVACGLDDTQCFINGTGIWQLRTLIEEATKLLKAQEPVVFCKDCKYGEPDTNGRGEDMVMCQNKLNPIGYGDWLMPPEFFCADGERRDDP